MRRVLVIEKLYLRIVCEIGNICEINDYLKTVCEMRGIWEINEVRRLTHSLGLKTRSRINRQGDARHKSHLQCEGITFPILYIINIEIKQTRESSTTFP